MIGVRKYLRKHNIDENTIDNLFCGRYNDHNIGKTLDMVNNLELKELHNIYIKVNSTGKRKMLLMAEDLLKTQKTIANVSSRKFIKSKRNKYENTTKPKGD